MPCWLPSEEPLATKDYRWMKYNLKSIYSKKSLRHGICIDMHNTTNWKCCRHAIGMLLAMNKSEKVQVLSLDLECTEQRLTIYMSRKNSVIWEGLSVFQTTAPGCGIKRSKTKSTAHIIARNHKCVQCINSKHEAGGS